MRFDVSSTTIRRRPGRYTRDRRETGRTCVTAPYLPTLADLERWPEFTFAVLDGRARVLSSSGEDWTAGMLAAAETMLDVAQR